MYDVYRDTCKIYFPNAVHCVDRFHLIQELNRKLDEVRKQVMRKFNKNDTNEVSISTVFDTESDRFFYIF